jgi:hypothetical protein
MKRERVPLWHAGGSESFRAFYGPPARLEVVGDGPYRRYFDMVAQRVPPLPGAAVRGPPRLRLKRVRGLLEVVEVTE